MLSVKGLIGGWGPTVVVEGVDLVLAEGETLAIIGRNGVGKTTLLELISGRARTARISHPFPFTGAHMLDWGMSHSSARSSGALPSMSTCWSPRGLVHGTRSTCSNSSPRWPAVA